MRKFFYIIFFITLFFVGSNAVNAATISEGIYTIKSALGNNKVLDVNGGNVANGTNVQLYSSNKTDSQRWYVKPVEGDYYEIISMLDENFVLDVDNAGKKNRTNVQIYKRNNTNAQKWLIKYADNGYYYVISKCNDLYLDVNGGSSADKTNIQMYKGNKTNSQKFKFIEEISGTQTLDDGVYNITSFANDNLALSVKDEAKNEAKTVLKTKDNNNWKQLWRLKYLGNGYYTISSYAAEMFTLDVKGGNAANETKIQIYNSNNTNAQKWIIKEENGYYSLVSALDHMYIDIKGGTIANGTAIQLYHGNDTNAQKFNFTKVDIPQIPNGYYTLNSALDETKVVDSNSVIAINNLLTELRTENNANSQKWYIEYQKDGYYTLKSALNNEYVLDVKGGGVTNETKVQVYKSNNTNPQKWYIKASSDGYYYLIDKNSGRYMDVAGGKTSEGNAIQIYNGNETLSQKFKLNTTTVNTEDTITQSYEEGYYIITSSLNNNKTIDISGGKKANGTNVWLYDNNETIAQIWKLKKLSDGYYAILSAMNPELALTAENANMTNGINVEISRYTGVNTQQWAIKNVGNEKVIIASRASGLNINVNDGKTTNGTNINLYENTSSNQQIFKLTRHTDVKIYNGIDVSYYQKNIDWEKVSNSGVEFAIIRAGYGGDWTKQDDTQFLNNVAACERYNIPYGLYLYSYASDIDNDEYSAQAEARHMLRLIDEIEKNNYSPNIGTKVFIDMEDDSVVNAGKDKLTSVSDTFCSIIEQNGYTCGIYANKTWLTNNLNAEELAKKYEIWLAEWLNAYRPTHDYAKTKKPSYNLTPIKYWQFASDGNINGISGNVDMDLGYDIFD